MGSEGSRIEEQKFSKDGISNEVKSQPLSMNSTGITQLFHLAGHSYFHLLVPRPMCFTSGSPATQSGYWFKLNTASRKTVPTACRYHLELPLQLHLQEIFSLASQASSFWAVRYMLCPVGPMDICLCRFDLHSQCQVPQVRFPKDRGFCASDLFRE